MGMLAYVLVSLFLLGLALDCRKCWEKFLNRSMDGSAQLPMRFAVGLLAVMVALAKVLEVDLVLGALMAGVLLRFGTNGAIRPQLQSRMDGVGGGFLVPLFFVVTGMQLDFAPFLQHPILLIWIPFLAFLMFVVRGLPVVLMTYKLLPDLPSRTALGLDIATQLPLVLAVVVLAQRQEAISMTFATMLVSAAVVSVMLFPALAGWLLSRGSAGNALA